MINWAALPPLVTLGAILGGVSLGVAYLWSYRWALAQKAKPGAEGSTKPVLRRLWHWPVLALLRVAVVFGGLLLLTKTFGGAQRSTLDPVLLLATSGFLGVIVLSGLGWLWIRVSRKPG